MCHTWTDCRQQLCLTFCVIFRAVRHPVFGHCPDDILYMASDIQCSAVSCMALESISRLQCCKTLSSGTRIADWLEAALPL